MATRILEIGTGSGDGTLSLVASLDANGLLITMEPDASLAAAARQRFSDADFGDRISVIVGEPARFLHKLRGPFDLIVQRHPDTTLQARLQGLLAPEGVLIDATGNRVTKYSE